ncbi:MAG TPA: YceH family protein [Longimicrobiales bacterium]|nr:YceH family protein [Longimicrobiales bacterium]
MDTELDVVSIRVLGSLIEKQTTTPDNYPLTLNALVTACNQSSNRDPVLALDDVTVSKCLVELSRRSLVREVYRSDSRAKRYRHLVSESMNLHPAETAVMCVLMLRGAQTVGEIRTRTARLFEFVDLKHVDVTLQALMTLTTPLVTRLERRPGQKEVRYAHLLSGEPEAGTTEPGPVETAASRSGISGPDGPEPERVDGDRVEALEQAVESLRAEMAELKARFEEFRREFQ